MTPKVESWCRCGCEKYLNPDSIRRHKQKARARARAAAAAAAQGPAPIAAASLPVPRGVAAAAPAAPPPLPLKGSHREPPESIHRHSGERAQKKHPLPLGAEAHMEEEWEDDDYDDHDDDDKDEAVLPPFPPPPPLRKPLPLPRASAGAHRKEPVAAPKAALGGGSLAHASAGPPPPPAAGAAAGAGAAGAAAAEASPQQETEIAPAAITIDMLRSMPNEFLQALADKLIHAGLLQEKKEPDAAERSFALLKSLPLYCRVKRDWAMHVGGILGVESFPVRPYSWIRDVKPNVEKTWQALCVKYPFLTPAHRLGVERLFKNRMRSCNSQLRSPPPAEPAETAQPPPAAAAAPPPLRAPPPPQARFPVDRRRRPRDDDDDDDDEEEERDRREYMMSVHHSRAKRCDDDATVAMSEIEDVTPPVARGRVRQRLSSTDLAALARPESPWMSRGRDGDDWDGGIGHPLAHY